MPRTNVPIYFSSLRLFERLNNEQLGALFRAVMYYAADGVEPTGLDVLTEVVFESMRVYLDQDAKKYEQKCERLRANGLKGGRPRGDPTPPPIDRLAAAQDHPRRLKRDLTRM